MQKLWEIFKYKNNETIVALNVLLNVLTYALHILAYISLRIMISFYIHTNFIFLIM